jgi:hypothetical protein
VIPFAWLGAHWGLATACVVVLALVVFFPEVAALLARWLIGTEPGRYLLLAGIVIGLGMYGWNARFSAGRASVLAEQKAAAARARANAAEQALKRDQSAERIGDKTQADTAAHIEQGKAVTSAAQGRTDARIKAQPAVAGCAGPDPGVMRDVQASDARLRAAADRMRRVGATPAR